MNTLTRYAFSYLPSTAKIGYLKSRGHVGHKAKIGLGSLILAEHVEIADNVRVGVGTHIIAETIKLGKRVWIGHRNQMRVRTLEMADDSEITNDVTVGGMDSPDSRLSLGKRSSIMAHSFINTTYPVEIGDDVGVGGYCKLFTHGSWQSPLDGYPIEFGPVKVGNGVWIPWDVFIMPNVTIGEGSTIGARALVRSSIPPHSLAVGIPAKVIKSAPDYPKPLSQEERLCWVTRIMGDMQRYFTWKRAKITIRQDRAQGIWSIAKNGEDDVLVLDDTAERISAPHVALKKGTDTLDLDKRWHREISDFLGRYGIRTQNVRGVDPGAM